MKDPYEEIFESIGNALKKESDMIVWIAKHTLSVSEYEDFIDKFRTDKKYDKEEIIK